MLNTTVTKIDGNVVSVKSADADQEENITADTVILASGLKCKEEEREAFRGTAYDVIMVGDCIKVGDLYNATITGYDAGLIL